MNNEAFKKFIAPYVEDAALILSAKLGEHQEMMMPFFVGFVCGMAVRESALLAAPWRDPPDRAFGQFTQEEIRRVFDYVRLRLETGSTTS